MTTVIGTGITATTVTVGRSSAFAAGIRLTGGVNTMTVTNSGTISVDAVTFDDGHTEAMGIVALANLPMDRHPDDILTIINSGDIVVRKSIDGGQTWRRGLAINVAGNPDNFAPGLPNKAVINLLGGNIYGNIADPGWRRDQCAAGGDVVSTVSSIQCALGRAPWPALLRAPGTCGVGALVINNGGTLLLRGPALPEQIEHV